METSMSQTKVDLYGFHRNLIYNLKSSIKKNFQIKGKIDFSFIES